MKKIKKYLSPSGSLPRRRLKFTPEQVALFESSFLNKGMNNSGGLKLKEEGVLALQHLELEKRKEEARIRSRSERPHVLTKKASLAEKLRGGEDEYELTTQVVGMSGADPLLSFYVGGVGLNGLGALAKTGLWNITKYTPTTQLGNWGRGYFVGNAFKNSFNGAVPTLTSLLASKNLFRTQVYKGGEITDPYSSFVTTNPLYAAHYGKVTPYIFESKSIARAKEPMIGSSDPVTMDMFVYNNTRHNPNATAIMGHDAVTGEFAPSRGIEILNLNPKNLYPIKTSEPSTSLKFFERKPARKPLSVAESLGISKGDRGNLSLTQRQAIEDLALYRNSGQYRQVFRVTPDWEDFGWNLSRDNPTFMLLFAADGETMRGPWARVVLQTPTGKGVVAWNPERNMGGYSSRMFKLPLELKYSPGEANMMIDGPNQKVILTSPRVDIQDFMDDLVNGTIEDLNLFKSLDSQLKRTIDKDVMKDFWVNSRKVQRPGSYMSGDNGEAPLGSTLIEAFKKKQLHKTPILETPIDLQIVRRTGLSPDSYSSIIRLGNRDGSLRWGEGFTNWNNSAIENKFVSDALKLLKDGKITPEQYEKIFNEWSLSIGGRPLLWTIVKGLKIPVHPHPYIYAKKQGGKMNTLLFLKNGSGIHIKKKNRGKFTDYCGGKVTDECIRRAKASGNPTLVKRATFADNARKWKHKEGGLIQKLQLGNYFVKPIKWLAHLINNYGNMPYDGMGLTAVPLVKATKQLSKKEKVSWPTNSLVAAAASLLSPFIGPLAAAPDVVFDVAASIDEPSVSNTLHTAADFPETVAKITPTKVDDYVARGVLMIGNVDDALSAGGKNLFEILNGNHGRITNTVDKASVRESTRTNSPKRTKSIKIKKSGGKAFVEGVNVLDSNPKAYKYVKKKYKMRMALDGTKFDWASTLGNVGSSILQGYFLNKKISREAEAAKAANKLTSLDFFNIYNLKLQEAKQQEELLAKAIEAMTGTTINSSNIVAANNAWKNASGEYAALKNNVDQQNRAIDAQAQALKSNIWGNAISGVMLQGVGLLSNYLNNKKSSNITTGITTPSITAPSYNYFSAPKKFGTFNNDGSMNLGYNMTYSIDKGIQTKKWSDDIFNKSYADYLK